MALFGNKKNVKEDGLVDQEDLVISNDAEFENEEVLEELPEPDLELRGGEEDEPEPDNVMANSSQGEEQVGFGFEDFINTFKEGKQEEVVLSADALKAIKEDIVLEKPKAKFKWGYIVWGAIFAIIIALSIFVAYIFANYTIVWNYNVAEAEYFFSSPVKMSITPQGTFCDTRYLRSGMDILYYEGDIGAFTHYKKFRIKDVNKTNVFGYDYDSKEYKNITLENIYYILDEDVSEDAPDIQQPSTSANDQATATEAVPASDGND